MPEYSHRGRDRLGHFPLTAMRASPQNRMIVGVTFAAATLGLFFIGVIAGRRRRPRPGNRPIEAELTLGLIPVCASFASCAHADIQLTDPAAGLVSSLVLERVDKAGKRHNQHRVRQ